MGRDFQKSGFILGILLGASTFATWGDSRDGTEDHNPVADPLPKAINYWSTIDGIDYKFTLKSAEVRQTCAWSFASDTPLEVSPQVAIDVARGQLSRLTASYGGYRLTAIALERLNHEDKWYYVVEFERPIQAANGFPFSVQVPVLLSGQSIPGVQSDRKALVEPVGHSMTGLSKRDLTKKEGMPDGATTTDREWVMFTSVFEGVDYRFTIAPIVYENLPVWRQSTNSPTETSLVTVVKAGDVELKQYVGSSKSYRLQRIEMRVCGGKEKWVYRLGYIRDSQMPVHARSQSIVILPSGSPVRGVKGAQPHPSQTD